MIKEIGYHGFTCAKNDRDCDDGDLALALNVLPENGALVGIGTPGDVGLSVDPGEQIWIHRNSNYEHYIYTKTFENADGEYKVFYWAYNYTDGVWHKTEDEGLEPFLILSVGEEILSVTFVGNTMIVSTSVNMYYYLCKIDDGLTLAGGCKHNYTFLGDKIPSVGIEFGLDLECKMKTFLKTGLKKTQRSESGDDDEYESFNCSKTLGAISFYIAEGVEDGDFKFDVPVQIERGHYYACRFSADIDSAVNAKAATLYGLREGSEEEETIVISRKTFRNFQATFDGKITRIHVISDSENAPTYGTIFVDELSDKYFNNKYFVATTSDNYEAIFGCINTFVADYGVNKNKFIHPFFVRYAVRLYDSSLCEVSTPILMTPNSGYVPYVWCNDFKTSSHSDDKEGDALNLYAYIAELKYKLLSQIDPAWEDIIQSIDIYVSKPIYPYNQGKEFSEMDNDFVFKDHIKYDFDDSEIDEISNLSFGIGRLKDDYISVLNGNFAHHDLSQDALWIYGFNDSANNSLKDNPWRIIQLAPKEDSVIDQEIKDESSFYLIKRVTFDELQTQEEFQDIEMEDSTLSTLEAREALQEDVLTYEKVVGGRLYTYNNRLHIYGGSVVFRDFVFPALQVQYDNINYPFETKEYVAYVYINTTDGVKIVKTTYYESLFTSGFIWFYYPYNRAFQVILRLYDFSNDSAKYYKFPLSEHNFLNGAYFFLRTKNGLYIDNSDIDEYKYESDLPNDDEIDGTLPSSSIYVSEVNNPFTFNNATAVTAGSGKVLALSAAAQAMSQGQFGQFPLYAFTDEGVWALEVNSDGTYLSSKPISRDVCINIDGVTSIDSSVVFPTARGIMEASGSRVECITDALDGRSFLDVTLLPHYQELMDKAGLDAKIYNFKDFLSTCHCIYDYANQRLFFYSPGNNMAYVLSLKDAAWGMAVINISSEINSYPGALGVDADGNVIDFSKIDETKLIPVVVITRPLKLEEKDTFKMVSKVYQRGFFRHKHLSQVLWGSRDLFSWETIGESIHEELTSLRGSGYKYLRIGLVGNILVDESLSGASMEIEEKLTNKIR